MGYLGRDVEVVTISPQQLLVASCDSCGAIGMKELDDYKISWSITGRFTTRVALLEVLATGAVPKMMTAAISNEPYPTGEGILDGVRGELLSAGLTLPMAISTEKNMNTQQTGLGISVIGVADKDQLRIGTSQSGDDVYCLGLPKVGPEVTSPEDPEIVQVNHIQVLFGIQNVHDIVPVGSRGILTEAQLLASTSNSRLILNSSCELNLNKSAGPSTCVLCTSSSPLLFDTALSGFECLPMIKIGSLE
jgi:Selenophosphate synthetase-related proteins